MPGLGYFNVIQAMIIRNIWLSWLISTLGSYFTGLLVFVVVKKFFYSRIMTKFKHYDLYLML